MLIINPNMSIMTWTLVSLVNCISKYFSTLLTIQFCVKYLKNSTLKRGNIKKN